MASAERYLQIRELHIFKRDVKHNLLLLLADVFGSQLNDRQVKPLRRRQQHAACFLFLPPENDRNAALHDARLFQSDFRKRIAENLHMVHADLGNDADRGMDDIRRVEPAAQTDLYDGDIHLFFRKAGERKRRSQLKLGDMHVLFFARLHRVPDPFDKGGELFPADGHAVQPNALIVDLDIRRCIQSGMAARRTKDALDHRAAGTLAVRARDMHHGQPLLRIAEFFHQAAHIFKTVFRSGRIDAVNSFDCFLFSHGKHLPWLVSEKHLGLCPNAFRHPS